MSEWRFLKTSEAMRLGSSGVGLDSEALSAIFLGPREQPPAPPIHPLCRTGQRIFLEREYRAAQVSFDALRLGTFCLPDPREPGTVAAASKFSVLPILPGFFVPPFLYRMDGNLSSMLIVCGSITGRVTLAIFPEERLVVHELADTGARSVINYLYTEGDRPSPSPPLEGLRIAVVDMLTNHAHQMLNHISAIQRLIELGLVVITDSIWTCGTPFFGPLTDMFPEIAGRHRHFVTRPDLLEALAQEPGLKMRIGSNYFDDVTRSRILGSAGARNRAPVEKAPLLYFTTRSNGRRCLNIDDCVAAIVSRACSNWPDTKVVIEGWTSPHDLRAGSSPYLNQRLGLSHAAIEQELAAGQSMASRLPARVLLRNLSGLPMRESISLARNVDAYFAHVGTLQHKIGFLSDSVGMAHGPCLAMDDPEGWAFAHAGDHAPTFVPAALIEDIQDSGGARGVRFNDYAITDPELVADLFVDMIAARFGLSELER